MRSGQRSGLSGVLILLSLGGMLLSVAIGLVPVHPVWKAFLSVAVRGGIRGGPGMAHRSLR